MDNLQPGQVLGGYRIINQIGQGGMATVYKAYQASMDRNVAIKVLPSQLAESKEFTTRFQQEARIIARLEHPHILPVFDYGETDGYTYFVMRYLEAGTLKDKMQAGPLSLSEIDRIFTQLADALGYAHSLGIIHRDLKPANALVDSHGNLFLTDFGIAKLLEGASPRLTQTDAIMGTPAYISPEQARSLAVDQRSDIYSLGIILYEMVAGRVPFVADTPLAVILKHVSDNLPLPTSIKADIPPAIEQVILKALAKNPEDRFATAGEFVSAWKRALDDKGSAGYVSVTNPNPVSHIASTTGQTQGRTGSTTISSSKSGSSVPWIVGCLIGVCLLFTVAGGAFLVFNSMSSSSQKQEPTSTYLPATPTSLPRPENTPTAIVKTKPIYEDDFSSEQWGTATDTDSSIKYNNNALQMIVFTSNWFVRSWPALKEYENIHLEVTIINNGTYSTTAFGLICNMQSSTSDYYYFAITPAGQYVIAKTSEGETDLFLTNNKKWVVSDLIPLDASSYRLGADCGNNRLTLYVNGQTIDSVTDSSYTKGSVALFTWSSIDKGITTDVSFDDFLITELP